MKFLIFIFVFPIGGLEIDYLGGFFLLSEWLSEWP